MSENPFDRLRQALHDIFRMQGAVDEPDVRALDVHVNGFPEPIPIRFFPAPKLTPSERVVIDAIRQAGEPLQQGEIAKKTSLALRVVQKLTPEMVRQGKLLKHPSLGFYVPGMDVSDFPP
jgi:hypothetical protein